MKRAKTYIFHIQHNCNIIQQTIKPNCAGKINIFLVIAK